MPEYIDREAVIKKIDNLETPVFYANGNLEWYQDGFKDALKEVNEILDNQPKADVAEVRHGKWRKIQNYALCSNCKHEVNWGSKDFLSPYCPKCGAKMDKECE